MREPMLEASTQNKVAVLGGGAWGTALAVAACQAGQDTMLWARRGETVADINDHQRNRAYLDDIALPDTLRASEDLTAVLAGASLVLLVTPAQTVAAMTAQLAPMLAPDVPVVLCSKGLDRASDQFLSILAEANLPAQPIAVLSGPSFASDVAQGLPTAVTIACKAEAVATAIASQMSSDVLRPYTSTDVTGVEIGGALKNVLAIASGIVEGRGFGASARAALMTRGFAELSRFGHHFGARRETLMGLSGFGDLVLSASSAQSRNFSFGLRLGQGESAASIIGSGPLAEGAYTARVAARIARDEGIAMPITAAIEAILSGDMTVDEARHALMARPLRAENA